MKLMFLCLSVVRCDGEFRFNRFTASHSNMKIRLQMRWKTSTRSVHWPNSSGGTWYFKEHWFHYDGPSVRVRLALTTTTMTTIVCWSCLPHFSWPVWNGCVVFLTSTSGVPIFCKVNGNLPNFLLLPHPQPQPHAAFCSWIRLNRSTIYLFPIRSLNLKSRPSD